MITPKIIIIFGLIAAVLIIALVIINQGKKTEKGGISFEEKQFIEAWIIKNSLNQYGDPKDTVYMGATPLFDERTGENIDKYEYILRNHPEILKVEPNNGQIIIK